MQLVVVVLVGMLVWLFVLEMIQSFVLSVCCYCDFHLEKASREVVSRWWFDAVVMMELRGMRMWWQWSGG